MPLLRLPGPIIWGSSHLWGAADAPPFKWTSEVVKVVVVVGGGGQGASDWQEHRKSCPVWLAVLSRWTLRCSLRPEPAFHKAAPPPLASWLAFNGAVMTKTNTHTHTCTRSLTIAWASRPAGPGAAPFFNFVGWYYWFFVGGKEVYHAVGLKKKFLSNQIAHCKL